MDNDVFRFVNMATSAANSAPRLRVEETAIIDAPISRVWSVVRSFSTGHRWLPGVAHCEIEGGLGETSIGAIRRLTLADGRQTREQLIGLSDVRCTLELTILETGMPVRNYVATFQLAPVSEGERCWISWSAEFEAEEAGLATLADRLRHKVFRVGFDGLRKLLGTAIK